MKVIAEAVLVSQLKSDDDRLVDEAMRYVYQTCYGVIENLVLKNNGSSDEVKDIFQDGVISLYNQLREKEVKLNCTVKTYLYSICRNLWLTKLKKRGREIGLTEEEEFIEIEEGSLYHMIESERINCVAKLLDELGGDCKKLLLNFYFKRMRTKEIMESMNLPSEQATKTKKSRCMQALRDLVNNNPQYKKILKG